MKSKQLDSVFIDGAQDVALWINHRDGLQEGESLVPLVKVYMGVTAFIVITATDSRSLDSCSAEIM